MIDLGNCYFCCDECPIVEDLERRLKLTEDYGFQENYCACEKIGDEFHLGGVCEDAYKESPHKQKRGGRKSGWAHRQNGRKKSSIE